MFHHDILVANRNARDEDRLRLLPLIDKRGLDFYSFEQVIKATPEERLTVIS